MFRKKQSLRARLRGMRSEPPPPKVARVPADSLGLGKPQDVAPLPAGGMAASSAARLDPLVKSSCTGIVVPTSAGQVPHLTPDMLAHLRARHSSLFISVPLGDVPLLGLPIHAMLNHPQQGTCIIITHRQPITSARGTVVWADPKQTSEAICSTLHPNEFVQAYDSVSTHVGNNRGSLAVERTRQGREASPKGQYLWSVVGKDQRALDASLFGLATEACRGVFIDVESNALVELALQRTLQAPLVRIVCDGMAGPLRILELFLQGANLIETGYAEMQARLGYACVFQTSQQLQPVRTRVQANARDLAWLTSPKPILPGCTCFACEHHTQAYVRHLVETREMLGDTLLMAHNLHSLLLLAESAGAARDRGELLSWAKQWRSLHY